MRPRSDLDDPFDPIERRQAVIDAAIRWLDVHRDAPSPHEKHSDGPRPASAVVASIATEVANLVALRPSPRVDAREGDHDA